MWVCICEQVKASEIEKLIDSGVKTMEELAEETSCGKSCTHCIEDIEKIISERVSANDEDTSR